MKLFISWSGLRSKEIATALYQWILLVIQAVEPFMSAEEIGKGLRWSGSLASELENSNFGLVCLTLENTNSTWLHFEAGALSKVVDTAKVAPLLFGLKPSDIQGPFTQFQFTNLEKDDFKRLMHSINNACGDFGLEDASLNRYSI
jgi:hypothetical protein